MFYVRWICIPLLELTLVLEHHLTYPIYMQNEKPEKFHARAAKQGSLMFPAFLTVVKAIRTNTTSSLAWDLTSLCFSF